MHYDPYESRASKKRRVMSDICLVIVILLMIGGILALIFRDTENPKFEFEDLSLEPFGLDTLAGGKSEFSSLNEKMSGSGQIIFDDDFRKQFPTAAALLDMDSSVYDQNKPFTAVGGGYIALAQCVVGSVTDCRDLSVTLIKINDKSTEDSLTLNFESITDYTVRYNTRDTSVPLSYFAGQSGTRLELFKIAVDVGNDTLKKSSYSLVLNHAFDEERARARLYHQIVFDPINNSYHQPKYVKNEKTTSVSIDEFDILPGSDEKLHSKYEINLNDKTFYLLDSVDLKYKLGSTSGTEITVNIN